MHIHTHSLSLSEGQWWMLRERTIVLPYTRPPLLVMCPLLNCSSREGLTHALVITKMPHLMTWRILKDSNRSVHIADLRSGNIMVPTTLSLFQSLPLSLCLCLHYYRCCRYYRSCSQRKSGHTLYSTLTRPTEITWSPP